MIIEIALVVMLSCAEEVYYPIDPNPPKEIVPAGCVVDGEDMICYPTDESGKTYR